MAATKKASKQAEAATETVVSIKGLDADFKCRDFQFEVGKTYEAEGKIVACENGFHAVDPENPFHVWDFYPVVGDDGRLTRYAEVVQSGAMERQDDDSKRGTKIASASITIKAELSLPDFIKRAVNAVVEATKGEGGNSSGNYAQIGSSGNSAQIGSSGDSAQIGSSGDSARIDVSGVDSVVAAAGVNVRGKFAAGTWVSLAEYDTSASPPKCIGFATGKVGHDGIPADTWLIAKGGKLVAEG